MPCLSQAEQVSLHQANIPLALLPGTALYPWMDAEIVRGDHLLEGKAPGRAGVSVFVPGDFGVSLADEEGGFALRYLAPGIKRVCAYEVGYKVSCVQVVVEARTDKDCFRLITFNS